MSAQYWAHRKVHIKRLLKDFTLSKAKMDLYYNVDQCLWIMKLLGTNPDRTLSQQILLTANAALWVAQTYLIICFCTRTNDIEDQIHAIQGLLFFVHVSRKPL